MIVLIAQMEIAHKNSDLRACQDQDSVDKEEETCTANGSEHSH